MEVTCVSDLIFWFLFSTTNLIQFKKLMFDRELIMNKELGEPVIQIAGLKKVWHVLMDPTYKTNTHAHDKTIKQKAVRVGTKRKRDWRRTYPARNTFRC